MVSYRFDLYPRTDPLGTLIRSFTSLQKAAYRAEANGTSTGQLAVRSTTDDGQAIDPLGLQYVRVTELPGGIVRGGFFLEKGKFSALTEDEDHLLTFSGAGTLSYLSRASMAPYTYLSNDIDAGLGSFDDAMDPFDDTWRLYAQGFGNTLGAMLWRVVKEAMLAPSGAYSHRHIATGDVTVAHDADRPESAIPAVTLTFDYETDTDGNPWTLTSGEFKAQVGENLLTVVKRLMEAGLYVELDPDTFELRAWEQDVHRAMLDATGGAWATDVVRFQSPTDPDDLSTGNIKDDALRNIEAHIKRSALWAGGNDIYGLATSPSDIPWEGHYRATLGDVEAQEGIAEVQLQAISEAGDTLKLRLWMEDDPANGRYLPWDHVLLDQQVTVHTGTDQWEFDERTFPVAALTIELKLGGNWDCIVELGASYSAAASRSFQVQGVGAHIHPPNPFPCDSEDVLQGITELKASGQQIAPLTPSPPSNANDGNDITAWGSGQGEPSIGVAGEWWAADLGERQLLGQYRILQNGGESPLVQNVATEVRIYATDDPAVWAALPVSGKISTDPADNGWTLLATRTNSLAYNDSGRVSFTPNGGRYVLFRAVAGGTADWDVETFELWSYVGTSRRVTRCDHDHLHPLLADDGVHYHDADQVDGIIVGGTTSFRDTLNGYPFPILCHRGDINPVDGYPENTLEACRQGMERGAHGFEFDVQRSADGTWYVIHDTTVTRTTDGTGNVADKTDAQMDALNIDGGYGWDTTRHGTSLNVPTMESVLQATHAYDPIIVFDLKEGGTGSGHTTAATAIAEYLVANGLVGRSIVNVYSTAAATAVKAVNPAIETMILNTILTDVENYADINRLFAEYAVITNLAFTRARAPKPVDVWLQVADWWGEDELPLVADMWERGARIYTTHDLLPVLAWRTANVLRAGDAAGVWHPVMAQDPSDSRWYVVVSGDGTAVMAEAP